MCLDNTIVIQRPFQFRLKWYLSGHATPHPELLPFWTFIILFLTRFLHWIQRSGGAPGCSGSLLGFGVKKWYYQMELGWNPEPRASEEDALSPPPTPQSTWTWILDKKDENEGDRFRWIHERHMNSIVFFSFASPDKSLQKKKNGVRQRKSSFCWFEPLHRGTSSGVCSKWSTSCDGVTNNTRMCM